MVALLGTGCGSSRKVSEATTATSHETLEMRDSLREEIAQNLEENLTEHEVITETVFSFPGLGILMTNAISQKDTPVVIGSLVVMALSVGVCNLLVDLIFAFVDPRIKSQYKKKG